MDQATRENWIRRFKTAGKAIPPLLLVIFWAPDLLWFGICAGALGLASWELISLTHGREDRVGHYVGVVLALLGFALFVWTRFGAVHGSFLGVGMTGLVLTVLFLPLLRPHTIPDALKHAVGFLLIVFYLGGSMAALALVRGFGTKLQGCYFVVLALAFAWASDWFAMGFGKYFQGPKLYAAVSPSKTWSGAVAGLGGSMLSALVVYFISFRNFPIGPWLLLALVAGILGQIGDLCESVLKRSAGVKDSGDFLPGHGGFLDRLDAVFFTSIAVYVTLHMGWLPFNLR